MADRIAWVMCVALCAVFSGCRPATRPQEEWTVEQYVKKLEYYFREEYSDKPLVVSKEECSDWFWVEKDVIHIIGAFRVIYAFDERPASGDTILSWQMIDDPRYTLMHFLRNRQKSRASDDIYFARFADDEYDSFHEKKILEAPGVTVSQRCYVVNMLSFLDIRDPFYCVMDAEQGMDKTPDIFEPEKALEAYLILRKRYREENLSKPDLGQEG